MRRRCGACINATVANQLLYCTLFADQVVESDAKTCTAFLRDAVPVVIEPYEVRR